MYYREDLEIKLKKVRLVIIRALEDIYKTDPENKDYW